MVGPDFKDCRHSCGEFDNSCIYCGALFYKQEKKQGSSSTSAFCCADGKIKLPKCSSIHKYISNFLTSSDKKSIEFRRNIRAYNTALSFTSLGVKLDDRFKNNNIPTFSIQGKLYHRMGSLFPHSENDPQFAQLYLYDTENELENRLKCFKNLDKDILSRLQSLMHRHNPYVHLFKQRALELKLKPEYSLILKSDTTVDRRIYNLPTDSEVAVLIPGIKFI